MKKLMFFTVCFGIGKISMLMASQNDNSYRDILHSLFILLFFNFPKVTDKTLKSIKFHLPGQTSII